MIGTMVWDTIYRHPDTPPTEEWGGISYALAGFEAALPPEWEIVPLIKVGRDLAPRANVFLRQLTRRAAAARFVEAPAPNNRVTLRYTADDRRSEQLRGGVPAWTWDELRLMARDLDVIYLNFISGFELDLDTAQRLRAHFAGPIYADLHSLLLGVAGNGVRVPRPLPDVAKWFGCFDAVQLNEDEIRLIGHDPMAVAALAFERGVGLMVVTLGPRGSVYFATGSFSLLGARAAQPDGDPIRTARIPAAAVDDARDPTGCGDVFGAALLAELLRGTPVEPALRKANEYAARNVSFQGASQLHHHLRGEIVPG